MPQMLGDSPQQLVVVGRLAAGGPGSDGTVDQRPLWVDDQVGIDLEPRAQAVARLAGTVRRVEREVAGRQPVEADAARQAGQVLGEDRASPARRRRRRAGPSRSRRCPSARRNAVSTESASRRRMPSLATSRSTITSTDVLLVACQLGRRREVDDLAVDTRPARSPASDRSASSFSYSPLRPRTTGARTWKRVTPFVELLDLVDDLLGGLRLDRLPAVRTVRTADAGEQQPQIVVDLGDRAHRRSRVAARRLLIDRDRRRQTLDEVDVGLVHLARGTAGRTPTAIRRTGVAPRRRSCRRRGSTCPSPTGR